MPKCPKHKIDLVSFCPTCRGSARSKRKAVSSRANGKLFGGRHKLTPHQRAESLKKKKAADKVHSHRHYLKKTKPRRQRAAAERSH